MAAFLLRSVQTSTRRCPVIVASGLSRNLLLPRFMASRPSSDQTLNKEEQPNQILSLSSSKAHLYVDVVSALRSPPGTFTRNQMFEIWCNKFHKSYSSEEEKFHRFKLFNNLLDYDIDNKDDNNSSTPTTLNELSDGVPRARHRLSPSLGGLKKRSMTAIMIKMQKEQENLKEFLREKGEPASTFYIMLVICFAMSSALSAIAYLYFIW